MSLQGQNIYLIADLLPSRSILSLWSLAVFKILTTSLPGVRKCKVKRTQQLAIHTYDINEK